MIYKIIITCGFFIAVYARDTFIHSRIIGGTEANKGEFPHLVSIQLLNSQHNCGGSILNEKWILTAAHCILKDNMLIKAGKHNVKIIEENEQSSLVNKIFVHKNYIPPDDGSVAPFDLALLKLKTPFKITRNVIPIQLCKKDRLSKSNATIAGWGKVSDPNGLFPDTLQKVTLPIIDLKTCNDSILAVNEKLSALHKTNICTGPLIGGHGACFGDSGSSLISYENGSPELIGVFSWITLPCAAPGRVSVYVRVSAFIDWIQEIISKN